MKNHFYFHAILRPIGADWSRTHLSPALRSIVPVRLFLIMQCYLLVNKTTNSVLLQFVFFPSKLRFFNFCFPHRLIAAGRLLEGVIFLFLHRLHYFYTNLWLRSHGRLSIDLQKRISCILSDPMHSKATPPRNKEVLRVVSCIRCGCHRNQN